MFQFFATPHSPEPVEGALYKTINLHGRQFSIYYGYYDELDRQNPMTDPMPIYPDLLADPQFTPDGYRFVTKMQDACPHFDGHSGPDKECAECLYYRHGDDLLGICLRQTQKP